MFSLDWVVLHKITCHFVDEVEAYNYVKNSIVAMLQSPDSLQLARDRIHQILQFWHVKGKVREFCIYRVEYFELSLYLSLIRQFEMSASHVSSVCLLLLWVLRSMRILMQ